MAYVLLLSGLFMLVASGNYLVSSASDIARKFNIPSLIIGLTVVSLGTSAPELIVSTVASLDGHSEIALGNVVGSNIVNIGFIMGAVSLILPFFVSKQSLKVDVNVMILFAAVFVLLSVDGDVSRIDGAILFLMLVAYTCYSIFAGKDEGDKSVTKPEKPVWKNVIIFLLALVGLAYGADFIVDGASSIAKSFGVTEKVISLTIVAIGTSLPEFTASLISVFKKEAGISIGNVIGSNIFNVGAVLGISSIISPIKVDVDQFMPDFVWLGVFSLFLLIGMVNVTRNFSRFWETKKFSALMSIEKGEIGRIWGMCALLLYVAYTVLLFVKD